MGLTLSTNDVDENGRELLTYGTPDFPIAFFDDDLSEITVSPHWHEQVEIVVLTKGTVQMRIAGNSFDLTAGEGYFANSGTLHTAALKTKTGHQHAMVFQPDIISSGQDLVYKTYVRPVLGNAGIPYIRLSPSVSWQKEILFLAERAWDAGAFDRKDYPLKVRENLSRLFSLIVENTREIENDLQFSAKSRRDEIRIKDSLLFIEKNYAEDISIDDIAKNAGISVSTCLRLFRTVLDTTPVQYLISYRLQRASEELRKADGRTIAEIAYTCGFSDASYFNRLFRRTYAITPGELRLR